MTNTVEYVVYETDNPTNSPQKGLKHLSHPCAHYTNYTQMVDDWFYELLDGTHVYFAVMDTGWK